MMLKMLGYVDEMPEAGKIRGRTLYYTIRFNLVHFLNTPFRFHQCKTCGKKFICHSLFLRKGHFGHNGCMEHWLRTLDDKITERSSE